MRHRIFVVTDISSVTAGVAEPDDAQSLIRLLLYQDRLEIQGLVASSSLGHAQATHPQHIERVLDAYDADHARLVAHGAFPPAVRLRKLVAGGQPVAGKAVPVEDSIGPGRATEGSEAIVDAVDSDDAHDRVLWIAVWGGTADVAQALLDVRVTRTRAELDRFLGRIRVHAINDQDSTSAWIRDEFPNLVYIHRVEGYRGIYRGGDTSHCDAGWVSANVTGHGALGDLYPNYDGGDIWRRTHGPVRGVKEGDTGSFLNLVHGDDPFRGWGGTLVEVAPNRFEDMISPHARPEDPSPRIAEVYRHRRAFQEDFARRLRWLNE